MKKLNRLDKALEWLILIIILLISYDTALEFNPYSEYLLKDKANFLKELNKFDEALEWLFANNYIIN